MDIPASLESRIRRSVRIRFRTLQAADRQDAEQEALAKVLQVDGARIRSENPWPFIERVAINAVIGMLRSRYRLHEYPVGEVDMAPDSTDPSEAISKRETLDTVMDMLDSGHPAWAQTARLCADGIGFNDVAHRTGVAAKTARTRMFRVRALARTLVVGVLLTLGVNTFGAATHTTSGPVYVAQTVPADVGIEPIQDWTVASAEAFYSLQPVTVTCQAIYLDPCPIGEVFVWGTVGASQYYATPDADHKSFFKFNDTRSAQGVVIYTQTRMYQGQRGRAHIIVEAKGRGVLMDFLIVAEGGL